jgi:GNAT superfamily N-acetyltransferase
VTDSVRQAVAPRRAAAGNPDSSPYASGVPVLLRDGACVCIREAAPEDWSALRAFGDGLGRESVYRRFHCLPKHPGRVLANAVCAPGRGMAPPERGTLLAVLGERIVGVVQWLREQGRGEAEVALVVADDARRRGIAGLLLKHARIHAESHGVRRLNGLVQGDNRALFSLVSALGVRPAHARRDGVCTLTFDLKGQPRTSPRPTPPVPAQFVGSPDQERERGYRGQLRWAERGGAEGGVQRRQVDQQPGEQQEQVPGTSCSAGISRRRPSRTTRARSGRNAASASTARSACISWTKAKTAFSAITAPIAKARLGVPVTPASTAANASNSASGWVNCRTNSPGQRRSPRRTRVLGPSATSRRTASRSDSPSGELPRSANSAPNGSRGSAATCRTARPDGGV